MKLFTEKGLTIRPIEERDQWNLWEITYKEESPEWKKGKWFYCFKERMIG